MRSRYSQKVIIPILGLALGMSGCVLLSPTDPYAPVAGTYDVRSPRAEGGSSAPERHLSGDVGLREAIDFALANNPDIGAGLADIDSATQRTHIAKAGLLPKLHAVGGYTHALDDQRLIPARMNGEPGVFSDDLLSTDLVVSMPLFTGGRIRSEIRANELLREAAAQRFSRTRDELAFNVTSVFYGILSQRQVIEAHEFSIKALEEHLRRIDSLLEAGKAAEVDKLRTEVRVADVRQKLITERNRLAIYNRVFANLMGIEDSRETFEVVGQMDASPAIGDSGNVSAFDAVVEQALKRRQDYLAGRSGLEAQAKKVDSARASRWPSLSLQGAYGERWATNPTQQPEGSDSSEDTGRVGLVLDFPLFEGGALSARVKEERAMLTAEQERLRKLRNQIRLEIETALLNLKSAAERVRVAEKSIVQAKESLRIEREKYELGEGTNTDVLDAQSELNNAQTAYYRALADYYVADAQAKLAKGESP